MPSANWKPGVWLVSSNSPNITQWVESQLWLNNGKMWWPKCLIIKRWCHQSGRTDGQDDSKMRFKDIKIILESLMMLCWSSIRYRESGYTWSPFLWEEHYQVSREDGADLTKSIGISWKMYHIIPLLWVYPKSLDSSKR